MRYKNGILYCLKEALGSISLKNLPIFDIQNEAKMDLKTETIDDILIIYPKGTLVLYDAPFLRDLFKEEIAKNVKKFIVNCQSLKFIDSSGMGTLISSIDAVKQAGGEIYFCEVSSNIHQFLKMVKLDKYIKVLETQALALEKFE